MSKVRFRFDVGASRMLNGESKPFCTDIREYTKKQGNVGNSLMYKATIKNTDFVEEDEAHLGDTIYFKANSQIGVHANGRVIDESCGSCEDVAEVLAYYILDNFKKKFGDKFMIDPTPYFFADFTSVYFGSIVSHQTGGLLDDYRLYGCASTDILAKFGDIVHGSDVLRCLFDDGVALQSSNNTIYNYSVGLKKFAATQGSNTVVDPSIPRRLFSLMFWDYFYCNSDRHCNNITFQSVPIKYNKRIIVCTKVLDNGGGLAMQSKDCNYLYNKVNDRIGIDGRIMEYQDGLRSEFNLTYDLFAGKEIFVDKQIAAEFDKLEYEEQLVCVIANNRTLFNDFKIFYEGIDMEDPFNRLRDKTSRDFLPNFENVVSHVFTFKKRKISEAIAKMLGEQFDEAQFNANQNVYMDKLEALVYENELKIHIASDEEIKEFNEKYETDKILLKNRSKAPTMDKI